MSAVAIIAGVLMGLVLRAAMGAIIEMGSVGYETSRFISIQLLSPNGALKSELLPPLVVINATLDT